MEASKQKRFWNTFELRENILPVQLSLCQDRISSQLAWKLNIFHQQATDLKSQKLLLTHCDVRHFVAMVIICRNKKLRAISDFWTSPNVLDTSCTDNRIYF